MPNIAIELPDDLVPSATTPDEVAGELRLELEIEGGLEALRERLANHLPP